MDIEIPKEEFNRQSRKRYLQGAAIVLLAVMAILGFRYLITPSADYSEPANFSSKPGAYSGEPYSKGAGSSRI